MSEHDHRFTPEEIKASLKDQQLTSEELELVIDHLEKFADILFGLWLKQRNNASIKDMRVEEKPHVSK